MHRRPPLSGITIISARLTGCVRGSAVTTGEHVGVDASSTGRRRGPGARSLALPAARRGSLPSVLRRPLALPAFQAPDTDHLRAPITGSAQSLLNTL
jgi:hypothetical protein